MADSQFDFQRKIEFTLRNVDANVATLSGGAPATKTISLPVQVPVATSAVTVLSAATTRCFFRIANNGPDPVNLAFNAVADLTPQKNTDPPLAAGGVYESPDQNWAAVSVSAICDTGQSANLVVHTITT